MTLIVPGDLVLIGSRQIHVAQAEWVDDRTVELTRDDGRVLRVRGDLVRLLPARPA